MKKSLTLMSLGVWTLSLLVGSEFTVAVEATKAHDLPYENQALRWEAQSLADERDVLLGKMAAERYSLLKERAAHAGRVDNYKKEMGRLHFQNTMMIESVRLNQPVASLKGSRPHEE